MGGRLLLPQQRLLPKYPYPAWKNPPLKNLRRLRSPFAYWSKPCGQTEGLESTRVRRDAESQTLSNRPPPATRTRRAPPRRSTRPPLRPPRPTCRRADGNQHSHSSASGRRSRAPAVQPEQERSGSSQRVAP